MSKEAGTTACLDPVRRTRRAYECRRVARAVRGAWPILLVLLMGTAANVTSSVIVPGAGIVLAWFVLAWRGQGWESGLVLGAIVAGGILATNVVAANVGCSFGCAECLGPVVLGCTIACNVISVLGGIAIGRHASSARRPARFAASALVILTLAGLFACGSAGLIGGLGGTIGAIAATFVTVRVPRRI